MVVGDIRLRSGETITCERIRQFRTYSGLLVGRPSREDNQRLIDSLLKEERERGWWAGEPYLVPPVITPSRFLDERSPFGPRGWLPSIGCVARFTAAVPNLRTAELTVIWFQDDFAFPIDPDVLGHLEEIDWATKAIVIDD